MAALGDGGRFELLAEAGEGGMSRVFRAVDRETGRQVAVKVLRQTTAVDAARLLREADVLAELRHPAVVEYVAHGVTDEEDPYLVLEWLEGETLEARMQRDRLDRSELFELGRVVAGALAAVHRLGIIHRDVKPANLLLVGGDVARVKLLDFGIARRPNEAHLTNTGIAIGSPAWMSPEQAYGERAIGPASDVHALGSVLYFGLVGASPYARSDTLTTLLATAYDEPPDVSAVTPPVPEAVAALIGAMLAKQPDRRPSASDVADALAPVALVDEPTIATRAPAPSPRAPGRPLSGAERVIQCAAIARGDRADLEAIRAALAGTDQGADRHATVDVLADGTLLAAAGDASGAQAAAIAAQAALAMRPLVDGPVAVVALPMTRDGAGVRPPDGAAHLLEIASTPAAIRVDAAIQALLGDRFRLRGGALEAAVELHEAAREDKWRLIGRARELEHVEAAMDASLFTEPRRAHALVVRGEAGIGKSRLRRELVERLRGHARADVWLGRADPTRPGAAHGALAGLVKSGLGLADAAPLAARRERLTSRVEALVARLDVARVAEFLGELVGTPATDEPSEQLRAARADARLLHDQISRAWDDLVRGATRERPLVLVLEDLHWGDVATVRAIDRALRVLDERPLFVLALARPELSTIFPDLWAQRSRSELELGPLTSDAAAELVAAVVDNAGTNLPLAERSSTTVQRAGGNPLFLEEIARASGEDLPSAVLATLQARLGAEAPLRRVLRAASCFDGPFSVGDVVAVLGDEEQSVADAALERLLQAGLVVEVGERRLAFRRPIEREAARASLLEEDHAAGHALAAHSR